MRLPKIQDWLNSCPARLDVVGPLEQSCVADHAIIDEGLIAGVWRSLEIVLVGEVQSDVAQLHGRPGPLSSEFQPDTFTWLNAKNHPIGMHSLDVCVAEKSKRRLVDTDRYLSYSPLQVFAGPQVEWDTGPTPVIYLQLAGNVGLDI